MKLIQAVVALAFFGIGSMAQNHTPPTHPVNLEEPAAENYLRSILVFSKKPDEADMDELSARLAWVLRGKKLPVEARERTILRANNSRPDKIKAFGFSVSDAGPAKRALSMAIVALDDGLSERHDLSRRIRDLETRLTQLEAKR